MLMRLYLIQIKLEVVKLLFKQNVIQNVVGVSAVRDLYGTAMNEGAIKRNSCYNI